jgi:citrate synthase
MKFKTAISSVNNGDEIIRGKKLNTLIKDNNFGDVIYLILKGKMPTDKESKLINAVLTSMIDHGV